MVIKKLKPDQYHALCHCLQAKAYAEPLDASYTVKMQVNSMEYAVKIQPEEECCVAALQALKIHTLPYTSPASRISSGSVSTESSVDTVIILEL